MRKIIVIFPCSDIPIHLFYRNICLNNPNFATLNDTNKALRLLSQERDDVLSELAFNILKSQDKRNTNHTLILNK